MRYSYSSIALEAVQHIQAERRFLRKHASSLSTDRRHLLWESAMDSYDEANYCRWLLLDPEEFYRRQR
jgi:hypothetical protein